MSGAEPKKTITRREDLEPDEVDFRWKTPLPEELVNEPLLSLTNRDMYLRNLVARTTDFHFRYWKKGYDPAKEKHRYLYGDMRNQWMAGIVLADIFHEGDKNFDNIIKALRTGAVQTDLLEFVLRPEASPARISKWDLLCEQLKSSAIDLANLVKRRNDLARQQQQQQQQQR